MGVLVKLMPKQMGMAAKPFLRSLLAWLNCATSARNPVRSYCWAAVSQACSAWHISAGWR
jgi:hypothetical protein